MRQTEVSETLAREEAEDRDGADEADKEKKGFFACYLLVSLNPRHKGHTYIGFTVNPRRRKRQHNGEIRSGAWRTKKRRPWEMAFCIYGFPTNVSALQFEWAWQHPIESLAVRKAAVEFKSLSGIANKIKLAYTMLTLPSWQSLNLTVNYFSTKYVKHSAGCPKLPENIKVKVCAMDELPCYRKGDEIEFENDDDDWDKEEFQEATFDDKFTEETISDPPPICNGSLDRQNGISNYSNESCRWNEGKDSIEQYSFTDFQVKSSANSGNKSVIVVVQDRDLPPFNEDSSRKTREHLTTTVTDNKPHRKNRNMSNEIEVIDVTTPSSLRRASVCNDSLDRQNGISNDSNESCGWNEGKDCIEQYSFTDFQVESSANAGNKFVIEEVVQDRDLLLFNEDSSWKNREHLNTTVTDNKPHRRNVNMPNEIEVIDVTTPSPPCRASVHGKKRRVSSGCSEIIDLTSSPSFVHL